LKNIFQCPESTIQSLEIGKGTELEIPLSSVVSEIIYVKPKPSNLTQIKLNPHLCYQPDYDLATLLRPLEEVKTLEHLDLSHIFSDRIEALSSIIPRLRGLTKITFNVDTSNCDKNKS
jgi:hypothetical protein